MARKHRPEGDGEDDALVLPLRLVTGEGLSARERSVQAAERREWFRGRGIDPADGQGRRFRKIRSLSLCPAEPRTSSSSVAKASRSSS
jgi:hypothetical protein